MKPTHIKHQEASATWTEVIGASAATAALAAFGYAAIWAINPANKAALVILGRLV